MDLKHGSRLRGRQFAGIAGLALAAALCAGSTPALAQGTTPAAPPASCEPEGGLSFVCGIRTPEDVVVVPGTAWVLSGADVPDPSGGLYLIDPAHPAAVRIAGAAARPDLKTYPDCAGPPDPQRFAAHGLNIRARGPGRATLYVVGHGGREAIEVFDVDSRGHAPTAAWIGCVLAPAGSSLNSVAGLGEGEIVATSILDAPAKFPDMLAGKPTGAVYARAPGGAFSKLPGTVLSGDNGLEVTADHKWMFVAATGTRQVLRYDRADMAKAPAVVALDFRPDNLRWSPDGKLLAAGEQPQADCPAGQKCPVIDHVWAIDPVSLKTTVVARFPTTKSWAGLSGSLIVGKTLWLGAHQGDRLAYRPLTP